MQRKRTNADIQEDACQVPFFRTRLANSSSSSSDDNGRSQEEDEMSNGEKLDYSCGDDMYPLRIYTDDLHHRREQPKLNDKEVARRSLMLGALSPFIKAFNTGDIEALVSTIHASCESSVVLQVEEWQCIGNGSKDMLGFWCLLHEVFPDAIMSILERRLRNNLTDQQQLRCVEYVCKLAGTRITTYPMHKIFTSLVTDLSVIDEVSATDLTDLVSKHFAQVDPSHFQERNCTYIIETVLIFTDDDLIQNMSLQILASTLANT